MTAMKTLPSASSLTPSGIPGTVATGDRLPPGANFATSPAKGKLRYVVPVRSMAMLSGRLGNAVVRTRTGVSLASAVVDRKANTPTATTAPKRKRRLIPFPFRKPNRPNNDLLVLISLTPFTGHYNLPVLDVVIVPEDRASPHHTSV